MVNRKFTGNNRILFIRISWFIKMVVFFYYVNIEIKTKRAAKNSLLFLSTMSPASLDETNANLIL